MLPLWKTGHYAKNGPKKTSYLNATDGDKVNDDGNENESDEHIFHQTSGDNLSKDWVLLDNQSTLNQFVNADYLTGIHTVANPITVYINTGSTSTNQKGMFG